MDSISRHEQLLRVFHLIDILFGARGPLSIAELKERLRQRGVIEEMSDKNLRRDIEFLANFGYAVRQSPKKSPRGGTCQAWDIEPCRGAVELRPPAVSLPELLSLAAAQDFLAPLAGTFYWRGISQLLARIEGYATPALLEYAAAHRDGLVVHPRPARPKYRSGTLAAIHRAIRRSVELEIRYTSLANTRPRRMVIRPEALVVYDGSIYVAARRPPETGRRREADDAPRFYKLDRLLEAKVSSRTFPRGDTPVETLLADSITLFRSPAPPRRYTIRVEPERARWACEKPFHPGQKVRRLAGGAVVLEIERAWDEEMIPQLLALGDTVEVLEPEDVRGRLADEARRILARYEGRPLRSRPALSAGG